MATGTIGSLATFDVKVQTWEEYTEILEQFFMANEIDDEGKQRAILISVVGAQTYERSYQQLVTMLKDHFNPQPSEIVQRFKFDLRTKKPTETMTEYVAELRCLAQDCNYGATLNQMLRDRLVCGIDDDRIQRRLLSETNLTFETALKIAVAAETTSKNVLDLKYKTSEQVCNSVTFHGKKFDQRQKSNTDEDKDIRECYRCGGRNHKANECRFKKDKCYGCGKIGHLAKACRNKGKQGGDAVFEKRGKGIRPHRAFRVSETTESEESDETFTLACVKTDELKKVKPFTVEFHADGKLVKFEIDTGSSVSLMTEEKSKVIWKDTVSPKVKTTKVKLKTYTGEPLEVVGVTDVQVKYQQQEKKMPLVVVKGSGPCLLGREWLEGLRLQWSEIKLIQSEEVTLTQVLFRHEEMFKEELGMLKGTIATLHVPKDASPRFFRPRSVPYALKPKKIISPVKYSEWAAPVVPIVKPDGSIRLCGDYKLTVNKVFFARLDGGKQFTKLDMSHAYQQIIMDEHSKKYLTVNTHKGLFTYNRLPFGVASAPAIFQRTMEGLLQGIPGVVYLDDILVTGGNRENHLKTLENVLMKLKEAGLRLKRGKCVFLADEVEYLGHRVDAQGLHPTGTKVKAIDDAPEPKNVTELKVYLGLLNYYNKFLPNLAMLLAPLHLLLRKDTQWTWKKSQQEAFKETVPQMGSPVMLQAYQYNIVYKPGKYHQNVDALSRLPVPGEGEVNAAQIRKWTLQDGTLSKVHEYVLQGWPVEVESLLLPYYHRRDALSVKNGCVTWRARIIIPLQGRATVLKQLHQTHSGMSRMKGLARSYMWWPCMDQDVEKVGQNCDVCQSLKKAPAQAPLHPWEWTSSPWERLHVDYAGPFLGKMFLILVDSHSKWMDVYPVIHATYTVTIEKLRSCFSTHGLPKMLVSDNATCFKSEEFETFMKRNGIQHVTSAPYHPSSNGLVERAVQTFKEGMKKMKDETVETRVARFLFTYRITPHATTGLSPAQMLMSRKLRSTFDLLLPDLKTRILNKQQKQKEGHDKSCKFRSFKTGDSVYVRNYSGGPKWIPAVVESCTGPLSYKTVLGQGQTEKACGSNNKSQFRGDAGR
ncbi:hypothetical protein IRJ41_020318 [Triplophysa rosa]|uniref:Gypsy retrotransposon integrase-like protein 1 n=1 Tax=Triplophysa rosa TaxID=992332 RepID=A0A9W7TSW4_TRIRA|nr:hypothetical protein IRJ41_020318 [Triplophysa rosa]